MSEQRVAEQNVAECWSRDQSDFSHYELGDLIDCYRDDLEPGSVVYVGDSEPTDPAAFFDAEDLAEALGDRAYNEHGEHAEDWPSLTREAKDEFNALLAAWIAKHCPPTFHGVTNIRPYTLTEEDLQE